MTDLITLAQAKQYLKITPLQTSDDAQIQAFVDGASEAFLTMTSLPYLAETAFTERRNGTGTNSITTRNRPLQTIASLFVNNIAVAPTPDSVIPGYYFAPGTTVIYLVGGYGFYSAPFQAIGFMGYPGKFTRGYGNVTINGTAGFPNQSGTVLASIPNAIPPATVSYYGNPLFAQMSVSSGATVTNQNTSQPMEQVSGTPASGQFQLTPDAVFVFAAADVGIPVQIVYFASTIPLDVQQCIVEMVAWSYKQRDRVGVNTERFADNLSQSYSQAPFSSLSKLCIQRYSRKDSVGW